MDGTLAVLAGGLAQTVASKLLGTHLSSRMSLVKYNLFQRLRQKPHTTQVVFAHTTSCICPHNLCGTIQIRNVFGCGSVQQFLGKGEVGDIASYPISETDAPLGLGFVGVYAPNYATSTKS